MRLFNVRGRLVSKNVSSHLVDWDGNSLSKIQFKVKQFLKPYWYAHIVYEEFPVYGSRMRVDILNATRRIAVEIQGKQHNHFNKFFHQNREQFWKSIKRDTLKSQWLEKNDFKLIEIMFNEVDSLSPEFVEDKFGIVL
jgi:hypothetical protein